MTHIRVLLEDEVSRKRKRRVEGKNPWEMKRQGKE
jgi:hypothetical protein